jgi:hypothetical protein
MVFMENIEAAEAHTKSNDTKTPSEDKKSKKKVKFQGNNKRKPTHFCSEHGPNFTHDTKDCNTLAKKKAGKWKNDKKKPYGNKTWTRKAEEETTVSKKDLAAFVTKVAKKALEKTEKKDLAAASKKRSANDSDTEDEKDCFLLETLSKEIDGFNYETMETMDVDNGSASDEVSC